MADDSNKTEKLISSPFKHTNNILSVYYYRVWFYSFYIFIPIFFFFYNIRVFEFEKKNFLNSHTHTIIIE